ncbi:PqqD family protein [Deinococcus oregonensis]|uniref:PqqD family protein n=1 Tax=Deinococcus oregonensis TaxID=1805970 RepID=A0ABV6B0R5_9DEIO
MWTPAPDVLVTDLETEVVLLQAGSGEMFQLNASGRAAWFAFPTDTAGVAAILIKHGAPEAQAQIDADAWLNDLHTRGLIQPG